MLTGVGQMSYGGTGSTVMQIELSSGTAAFVQRPPTKSAALGVVLATDIFGLRPAFENLATRLAAQRGWTVVATDSLPQLSGRGFDERMAALPELDDDRQLGDLELAADAAGCDRVALVGFCMGGSFAMKARPRGRFERIVSFYGMVHPLWAGPGQADPLERAAAATEVPLLAIAGEEDEFVPAEHLAELEQAKATVLRFAGAGHAFAHDPEAESFRPEAAADAWGHAHAFLDGLPVAPGEWNPATGFVPSKQSTAGPAT
jgi:carboxymethylenebutenolidase